MATTSSLIKSAAWAKGMACETVILGGDFNSVEYLAVKILPFKTAFFEMDSETFDFTYSHTYNAATDKTTKTKPKGF